MTFKYRKDLLKKFRKIRLLHSQKLYLTKIETNRSDHRDFCKVCDWRTLCQLYGWKNLKNFKKSTGISSKYGLPKDLHLKN